MMLPTSATARTRRSAARVLGLAACLAVAAIASTRPGVEAAPQRTPDRHLLWRVDGGGGTGYLMGSLHVLTPEHYPLSPVIERAFDGAATLVEEIDLAELEDPATRALILGKAMFPDGATIGTMVSKETVAAIEQRAATAGLPAAALKRLKPWMIAVTLLGIELKKAGFDPNLGLDRYFFQKARESGKTVIGLETAEYQVDRFEGMSMSLQEEMLRETLQDFDRQRDNARTIAEAWRTGDAETLERFLLANVSTASELYDRLLVERNRNWLPGIEKCLASSSPCFVVVGAAHLVGPDSLVAMMTERGYRVVQQ